MKINKSGNDSFKRPSQALGHGRAGQGAGLQDSRADHNQRCALSYMEGRRNPGPQDSQMWGPRGNKAWKVDSTALLLSASYLERSEMFGKFFFFVWQILIWEEIFWLNWRLSKCWRGSWPEMKAELTTPRLRVGHFNHWAAQALLPVTLDQGTKQVGDQPIPSQREASRCFNREGRAQTSSSASPFFFLTC